jgi:AcrR family transcriptional regulator
MAMFEWPPLDLIESYVDQDLDRLDRLQEQARRQRRNAVRRLRRRLAGDPDRLGRFVSGLTMAANQVKLMETRNHLIEQCTDGTLRAAIFEVGKALVARGTIDEPDDVLHISAVIQAKDATTSIREGQVILVDGDLGIVELDV